MYGDAIGWIQKPPSKRWRLLAQKSGIAPIPGTTKLHRLEENIASTAITLSERELENLNDASAAIALMGNRYPPELMKRVGL